MWEGGKPACICHDIISLFDTKAKKITLGETQGHWSKKKFVPKPKMKGDWLYCFGHDAPGRRAHFLCLRCQPRGGNAAYL